MFGSIDLNPLLRKDEANQLYVLKSDLVRFYTKDVLDGLLGRKLDTSAFNTEVARTAIALDKKADKTTLNDYATKDETQDVFNTLRDVDRTLDHKINALQHKQYSFDFIVEYGATQPTHNPQEALASITGQNKGDEAILVNKDNPAESSMFIFDGNA